MPSPKVLANAKRGSIPDLQRLWQGMGPENYSLESLTVILSHLKAPGADANVTKQEHEIAFTILEHGLKRAITTCPPSLATGLSQQLALACEGIVFWMGKFVGEGGDAMFKSWKFQGPNGQDGPRALALYNSADIIIYLLTFDVVAGSLGKLPLLHQVILDWWTATCDGEILLYPGPGRGKSPQDEVPDLQVLIFASLSRQYAKEMAEAIMSPPPHPEGRTPEMFATRTIQRMRSLTRINTLQHLAHWPDATNEMTNVNGIMLGLVNLVKVNSDLHMMLLREKIPESFLEDFSMLSVRPSTPPLQQASMESYVSLISALCQITRWSSEAPVSQTVQTMKYLLKNGLLNIAATYINMRTEWDSENSEAADCAAKAVLFYCCEASFHPRFTPAFRRGCRDFMKKIHYPLPTPQIEVAVNHYVVGSMVHLHHLPLASRVEICDSVSHRVSIQHVVGASNSVPQKCSKCHTVVYCSPKCQKEDWRKGHRDECDSLRAEYSERKALKSWYSHNVRTFHLSCIRYAFATTNSLWNVVKGRRNCVVDSRIVVSATMPVAERPYHFNTVEEYVDITTPLLPQHKLGRFNELVARFRTAKAHPQATKNGVSFLSLGLVNGAFRFGDVELSYVVLLRRRAEAPLPGGPADFEVEGYVTYTCEIWDRVDTCSSPMESYIQALVTVPGYNIGDIMRLYEM